MTALIMSQGDIAARHMLKNALKARYGANPPSLENVIVDFQGHLHQQTPSGNSEVVTDATAMFHFPYAMRWDFVTRSGVGSSQYTEAFDGTLLHQRIGSERTHTVTNLDRLQGTIRRFWTMAALFITPLSASNIQLRAVDWRRFYFRESQFGSEVLLRINQRFEIECIQTLCDNPETSQQEIYSIVPSTNMIQLDGIKLPRSLRTYWGERIQMELQPVSVATDIPVPANMFQLVYESNDAAQLSI